MNENIDLTQILKGCPEDTVFYSSIYGDVTVCIIETCKDYPIALYKPTTDGLVFICRLTKEGKYNRQFNGECVLFPSKEQRDWSKFTAPWYKPEKKKFDPKTLKPFDKVIVKGPDSKWLCGTFSHYDKEKFMPYICIGWFYDICIPYNDGTKHLLGTTDEAPEYYRYWEDSL